VGVSNPTAVLKLSRYRSQTHVILGLSIESGSIYGMKDDLIRSIKTEADYQAALNRARSLMSCRPNTPKADELEIVEYLTLELY
jgi:hypothetical protein